MTSNLLLQLDDLELALHRYCFLELGVGDATRLKRAFLAFKERLVAKMYAEEDFAFRQSITRAVGCFTYYTV